METSMILGHQNVARKIAFLISLIIIIIGISTLVGWIFDITVLKSILPGLIPMQINTAIGMLMCGISLALQSYKQISKWNRVFNIILDFVVIAMGLLILSIQLGVIAGINPLQLGETPGLIEAVITERMSPNTAFCFLLIGSALFIMSQPSSTRFRLPLLSSLGATVIIIAGIGLLSHTSNTLMKYQFWNYASMAINTELAFVLLGTAILALVQSEDGLRWSLDKFSTSVLAIGILLMLTVGASSYHSLTFLQSEPQTLNHIKSISTPTLILLSFGTSLSLTFMSLGFFMLNAYIGQHKKTEEALMNSQSYLQRTFDSMTEAIIVFDLNLNIILYNQASFRLLDISDPKMSPKAILGTFEVLSLDGKILPTEDWPYYRALRGQFLHNDELQVQNKETGKKIFAEFNTAPIKNKAGDTTQIMIAFRDVTERKLIEATHAQLAAIVESSEDAIIAEDLNGIIVSWNPGAEKIFGYSASEMIGQTILKLMPPDHEHDEEEILNRIKRVDAIIQWETVRKRKDGKVIDVSITISPISNKEGKIIGASKIARNITERKQLEQQLRQGHKMQAIGELTGGIAHDFNNILGVVLGNLELLERLVIGNESAIENVQDAKLATMRGADLTKQLLAFSHQQQLKPVVISLNETIGNIITMATRTLGPNIKITTNLEKSIPPVFVDVAGLENSLLNLAINARDAMPKGGTLTITTQLSLLDESYPTVQAKEIKPGEYIRLSISDTGLGMSQETLERVFEPFFTTKPRGKGTGLGLAMVYGFIKQSGGFVRIYSELGHGTSVSLYLPVPKEGSSIPIETNIKKDKPARFSGTVLVVDDEVALLKVAVSFLKEMGYTVLQATNATSALDIIKHEKSIELLVTDIIMPGELNGTELAKEIRQLHPETVIVYTSGFPSGALTGRAETHIDAPLIQKPYNRNEFVSTIRNAVESNGLGD